MKKNKRNFIYFVLVAPILAKVIEWIYQSIQPNAIEFIKSVWFSQIILILVFSLVTYFIMFEILKKKKTPLIMASIVGIAYFLKEVYNLIFVHQTLNQASIIALTIEPIFMYVIIGLWLPKLIFKK